MLFRIREGAFPYGWVRGWGALFPPPLLWPQNVKENSVPDIHLGPWIVPWHLPTVWVQDHSCLLPRPTVFSRGTLVDIRSHEVGHSAGTMHLNYFLFSKNNPKSRRKITVVHTWNNADSSLSSACAYMNFSRKYDKIDISLFWRWATPCGMWDLSSPTRDQTRAPCSGSAGS